MVQAWPADPDQWLQAASSKPKRTKEMKQFTIEVSHASPGQLQTIAAELKIMGNGWEKFGPRITINKRATSLTMDLGYSRMNL